VSTSHGLTHPQAPQPSGDKRRLSPTVQFPIQLYSTIQTVLVNFLNGTEFLPPRKNEGNETCSTRQNSATVKPALSNRPYRSARQLNRVAEKTSRIQSNSVNNPRESPQSPYSPNSATNPTTATRNSLIQSAYFQIGKCFPQPIQAWQFYLCQTDVQ
jgi:hypothetical protein